MTALWLGMLALCLFAVALILLPWLRPRQKADTSNTEINIALTQQRLDELAVEQQQDLLSAENLQQAEQEIKLALVHDTSDSQQLENTAGLNTMLVSVVALVLILVTFYSYWQTSEVEDIHHWQQTMQRLPELGKRVVLQADETVSNKDLQDFALGLRTQLAHKPDDAVGWLLLGRVYASRQLLEHAIEAYEKSLTLDPNRSGTLVSYSQALLMTGQDNSIKHALSLLTRVIIQDPQSRDALGLLAIAATQLNDNKLALKSWQQLQALLSKDEPLYAEVGQRIQALNTSQDSAELALPITVDISADLKAKLPQQGYLFVFAQDANSENRMPAAVVKLALADFPTRVTLSDQNAMLPQYKLSQLTQVKLTARVSMDESVEAQQGELQGQALLELTPGLNQNQMILLNEEIM